MSGATALRRLATIARVRACPEAKDLPAPLHTKVRVIKGSLAAQMRPGDLGWFACRMRCRFDVDDDDDDDGDVRIGEGAHFSVGWLDTMADRCDEFVTAAAKGLHTDPAAAREEYGTDNVTDVFLESARAFSTRDAVMERIATVAAAHLSQYWETIRALMGCERKPLARCRRWVSRGRSVS